MFLQEYFLIFKIELFFEILNINKQQSLFVSCHNPNSDIGKGGKRWLPHPFLCYKQVLFQF